MAFCTKSCKCNFANGGFTNGSFANGVVLFGQKNSHLRGFTVVCKCINEILYYVLRVTGNTDDFCHEKLYEPGQSLIK